MPAACNECLLKIDLAATSNEARHTFCFDRLHDGIAAPSILQHLGTEKRIILVICMMNTVWNHRNSQAGETRKTLGQRIRVTASGFYPPQYFCEGYAAECRLHLCHSPIRAERFVKPTKAVPVLAVVNRIIAFAVVFKAPRALPNFTIVRRQHSSLDRKS